MTGKKNVREFTEQLPVMKFEVGGPKLTLPCLITNPETRQNVLVMTAGQLHYAVRGKDINEVDKETVQHCVNRAWENGGFFQTPDGEKHALGADWGKELDNGMVGFEDWDNMGGASRFEIHKSQTILLYWEDRANYGQPWIV